MTDPTTAIQECNEAYTRWRSEKDWLRGHNEVHKGFCTHWPVIRQHIEGQAKTITGFNELCNAAIGELINEAPVRRVADALSAGVDWDLLHANEDEFDAISDENDALKAKVEEQAEHIKRLEFQLTPEALTKYRSEWGDWDGYPTAYERDLAYRNNDLETKVEEQAAEIELLKGAAEYVLQCWKFSTNAPVDELDSWVATAKQVLNKQRLGGTTDEGNGHPHVVTTPTDDGSSGRSLDAEEAHPSASALHIEAPIPTKSEEAPVESPRAGVPTMNLLDES